MKFRNNIRSRFEKSVFAEPCRVYSHEDLLFLKSPLPSPGYNGAWGIRSFDDLKRAKDFFQENVFGLFADPDRPLDVSAATSFSFLRIQTEMTLDLESAKDSLFIPQGVKLHEAKTTEDLELFAKATDKGFPLIGLDNIFAYATAMRDCSTIFIAMANGRTVGAAQVHIDDYHTAGIYYVSVVEEMRGHGIGRALTTACLQKAKDASCTTAVLYASELGAPLYLKMGFRPLKVWQVFLSQKA